MSGSEGMTTTQNGYAFLYIASNNEALPPFSPKKQNSDCVRKTYARYGVERFYRGAFINILRMAPNTAIQFGSYELLKQCTAGYF